MNPRAPFVVALFSLIVVGRTNAADPVARPPDNAPLAAKAAYLYQNLLEKHSLDGLYVSITPTAPDGVRLEQSVNTSGNVIHAGVWTGRYLGGVAYWYAVTKDPEVRAHGGEVL